MIMKGQIKNVSGILSRDEMKQILGGCSASASCGGGSTISCSGVGNCYGGDNGSVSCRQANGESQTTLCPRVN